MSNYNDKEIVANTLEAGERYLIALVTEIIRPSYNPMELKQRRDNLIDAVERVIKNANRKTP
jgi:hypothetical protein